jgi:hypothetical protein
LDICPVSIVGANSDDEERKSTKCSFLIQQYTMKVYRGVDVEIHIFLTSALAGGERLASCPDCFTPGERIPSTHWAGGWVDPRAGLDDMEKRKFLTLPGLELQPLGHPAHS